MVITKVHESCRIHSVIAMLGPLVKEDIRIVLHSIHVDNVIVTIYNSFETVAIVLTSLHTHMYQALCFKFVSILATDIIHFLRPPQHPCPSSRIPGCRMP